MAELDSGRGVLVSGGTGALGRAVVARFLAAGDRVALPWIVKRELDALAADEGDAIRRGRIVPVECDVADEAGARLAAGALPDVDVLVNGVGGFAGGQSVHASDLDLWDRMWRMNVRTAVSLSRAVLPGMLARRRGVIVNISSRAALDLPAGLAAYATAKRAVLSFAEVLQKEVADHSVRVNTLAPTT